MKLVYSRTFDSNKLQRLNARSMIYTYSSRYNSSSVRRIFSSVVFLDIITNPQICTCKYITHTNIIGLYIYRNTEAFSGYICDEITVSINVLYVIEYSSDNLKCMFSKTLSSTAITYNEGF